MLSHLSRLSVQENLICQHFTMMHPATEGPSSRGGRVGRFSFWIRPESDGPIPAYVEFVASVPSSAYGDMQILY